MKKIICFFSVLMSCNISFSQDIIEEKSIENQTKQAVFKSHPNPVKDQLFVLGTYKIKTIVFYDVLGKQVAFYQYDKSIIKVNVSDLKAGVYLMKVTDEKDKVAVKRIVKK